MNPGVNLPFCTHGKIATMETATENSNVKLMKTLLMVQLLSCSINNMKTMRPRVSLSDSLTYISEEDIHENNTSKRQNIQHDTHYQHQNIPTLVLFLFSSLNPKDIEFKNSQKPFHEIH